MNGFPVCEGKQVHTGMWFITSQRAFKPQEPGQGSTHFCLMQAKFAMHSEYTVHSGRQFGGLPM